MQLRDDDSDDTHYEWKQDDSRVVGGLAADSHSSEGALSVVFVGVRVVGESLVCEGFDVRVWFVRVLT